MAKWVVAAKRGDFDGVGKKYNISPVIARIIRNRDVIEDCDVEQFLYGTLDDLYSPLLMKDMSQGVKIIKEKIQAGEKIRVIGDYDVDGICSSFILKTGIASCGGVVDTAIPHRIKDGYGLNDSIIKEAYEDGIDTIITCDNGISASEQISYAKQLGMTVIVTDHHEVPYEENETGERIYVLPKADAVIDIKQEDCLYPFKGICGEVVAYKFVQALVEELKADETVLKELLEFAALATVGDVMELLGENRIIVKYGLQAMAKTNNIGLKALLTINGIEDKALSTYHLGFIIGPCLNATGRLDTAQRALELFEAKDTKEAAVLAADLKALNDSRKEMTAKGTKQAIEQIEHSNIKEDKVIVIYLEDCHESLAGIIAGRVREKYGKPTFILTCGEEGVKGSGRSIDAFHMYEEMNKHKELFLKFGGHKLAAGLSMEEKNIEKFRCVMNQNCLLTEEDFEEKICIDVPMPIHIVTEELLVQLEALEPFGVGNKKPVFAQKGVRFLSGKILGINKNVGKFVVLDDQNKKWNVIYFGDLEKWNQYLTKCYGEKEMLELYGKGSECICVSMLYYPTFNEFKGNVSIQLVMQDYQ